MVHLRALGTVERGGEAVFGRGQITWYALPGVVRTDLIKQSRSKRVDGAASGVSVACGYFASDERGISITVW